LPIENEIQRTIRQGRGWKCGWFLVLLASTALGQSSSSSDAPEPSSVVQPVITMFPHSPTARYWISGQDNIIFQYHPSFEAKYSGPNSLHASAEHATSNVSTLFLGYSLGTTTEVFLDLEEASGGGLTDALGLAGETNIDVVRNPLLSKAPYVARVMVREIIPLTDETLEVPRGPLALMTRVPVRRLEIGAGKFGAADFFDTNGVGSDSHFQFMNWTVDNNGAYDYAADTRGYTFGVLAEYHERNWAFRFAEALMPTVANGPQLVWNLRRARAENYELELHPKIGADRTTVVRLLGYENHANMGVYRDAVENFLAGRTATPDITAHPRQTTVKYGFGVNLEHEFTPELRGFARWGWNEGQHESYAYTEDDETVAFGADLLGPRWQRKLDKVGMAFVTNGISADHQHYLELGGKGFLLGDGGLRYGRENIVELYYDAHVWRGWFLGPDLQHVNNPGYNRDRGPVLVPGFRFHTEF
jgi:high affinity Mn2+ porin